MPGKVLGKRSRSDFDVVVSSSPRSTRAAKRNVVVLDEEDVADTIVVRSEPVQSPRTPKKARLGPRKKPTSAARQPLSPQKVNAVFRATKATATTESKKSVEPTCPQTPRHRDAQAKMKLQVTPRHRVSAIGKPITPRSRILGTPTASTPTTVVTVAKSMFSRSTAGGRLIGRDNERTKLHEFVKSRMETRKGGCLYVSGPPGCGKSALLMEVVEELAGEKVEGVNKAWINCMSLHTPGSIYAGILDALSPNEMRIGGSDFSDLEEMVITAETKELFVVVLDEIDHLLTNDILPTLFELSLRKNSRLALVGIANALDLTDRFLPRLKAKNLEPDLLPFFPYTAPQITQVVTHRLRSLLSPEELEATDALFTPFVHPAAIQLLARKVEAASGDLRKAFDILRKSLELMELESLRSSGADNLKPVATAASPPRPALIENPNVSSPSSSAMSWTPTTAPRATLAHVAKAASTALGSSISTRVAKLNAHARSLLCVLVSKSGTAPTGLRRLREAYADACREDGVAKLAKLVGAEFRAVVEALEAAGVVDVIAGGKTKGKGEESVVSRVGKMDLITAVSAPGIAGKDVLVGILGGRTG